MGIPSYYSYLIKNYNKLLKNLSGFDKKVDNFYLDSNSIIYDCLNKKNKENKEMNKNKKNKEINENELIKEVCIKIDEYIKLVKPKQMVYISFDGIAPVAKLKQQKERRYKSKFMEMLLEDLYEDCDIEMKEKASFDKTCITPGTNFMKKLDKKITEFFRDREKIYDVDKIIVSGSEERGEGEHKIFEKIRNNKNSERHVIYGLDADLIILCLNHLSFSKDIYLFRETPDFASNINANIDNSALYLMDIYELMNLILGEMFDAKNLQNKENLIKDYVFLMMFMGNDFMPHFPSLNIRTFGIHMILELYKVELGNKKLRLIEDNEKICWKNLRELLEKLAKMELDNLKKEYGIRNRIQKNQRVMKMDKYETLDREISMIPINNRDVEMCINPYSEYWENRYYNELFDTDRNEENLQKICMNFLEGLDWNMRYYSSGCYNWKWKYKYNYPPLFVDLLKYVPLWDVVMIEKNQDNISSTEQLAYVLPEKSLYLLENELQEPIRKYKVEKNTNINIKWAFCKYFWESHICFLDDNLSDICEIVKTVKNIN
jgi:5'-3' exonuclease